MAITVPTRFVLVSAQGAGNFSRLGAIEASDVLEAYENAANVYGAGTRVPLIEHGSIAGIQSDTPNGSSAELVLVGLAVFGEQRKAVVVSVDAEDCYWELRIRDAGDTTTLGSTSRNENGRANHEATVTLASAAQEVLLILYMKVSAAPVGTIAKVHSICALEESVADADLDGGTFQAIDDTGITDDEPMSTQLLQDVYADIDAARTLRIQRQSITWDYRNLARVCGLKKMSLVRLVRLPPGTTGAEIEIRGTVAVAAVTVGVRLLRIEDFGLTRVFGEDPASATIAIGTTTTTITVDPGNLLDVEGDRVAVLLLTFTSAEGTPVTILDAAGSSSNIVLGWTLNTACFSEEIDLPTGIPQGSIEMWLDAEAPFPGVLESKRQVLRILNPAGVGNGNYVVVWPPFSRTAGPSGVPGTGFTAVWTPLGYMNVGTIEFRPTQVRPLPDIGSRYNAGAPPSSSAARYLYLQGEQVWSEHGRVHGIGPGGCEVEYNADDTTIGLAWHGAGRLSDGAAPVDPIGNIIEYNMSSFETAAVCHTRPGHPYKSQSGALGHRQRIDCWALCAVVGLTRSHGINFDLTARLVAVDAGTLLAPITGEESDTYSVSASVCVWDWERLPVEDLAGFLLGYSDRELHSVPVVSLYDVYSRPACHALRGLVPTEHLTGVDWVVVRASVLDTPGRTLPRRVELQIKGDTFSSNGEQLRDSDLDPTDRGRRIWVCSTLWTTSAGVDVSIIGT